MNSDDYRNKGNKFLASANDSLPNLTYYDRCDQAIEAYKSAVSKAKNEDQYAMAFKNIGFTYMKKSIKYNDPSQRIKNLELSSHFYKESLKYGEKVGKNTTWINGVKEKLNEIIFFLMEISADLKYTERIKILVSLIASIIYFIQKTKSKIISLIFI